jgi:hypothetical protein
MNKLLYILFFLFPLLGVSQTDTIVHLYTFGGNNNDNAEEIVATNDGGYIVIGSTSSNSWGNTDAYLLKVDSLCNYEWSKALGGSNNDWGYSIKQTFDKGFIIALTTNSFGNGGYDACLMKRDSLGDYEWTKTYGGIDWDFAYSVVQTHDSGYVFCGETYNNTNGYSDVYIVKTNNIGDTLWTKTIGGSLVDKGNAIIETSDSNIVVAGITNTIADSTQMYVLKLSLSGALLWDSIYGDTLVEKAYQIIENSNGDFVIAGSTTSKSLGGDKDYLIKGVGINGNPLWEFFIVNGASPTPDDDEAFAIHELQDTKLLISGYSKTGGSSKNIIFYKLNINGGWAGSSTVIGNNEDDFIKSIAIGKNGNILGAGSTNSFGSGMEDMFIVRLDTIYGGQDTTTTSYFDVIPLNILDKNLLKELNIYPNPAINNLIITSDFKFQIEEINIYDLTGRLVYARKGNKNLVDISNLTKGVYFIQVKCNSQNCFKTKFIKY